MYQHDKQAIGDESAIEYVNDELMVLLNVRPLAFRHCQNCVRVIEINFMMLLTNRHI